MDYSLLHSCASSITTDPSIFSTIFDHARWMAQTDNFEHTFLFFILRGDKLETKAFSLNDMTHVEKSFPSLITPSYKAHGIIVPCAISKRKAILMQIIQHDTMLCSVASFKENNYTDIEYES